MAFVPLVCASGIESVWSTTGPLGLLEIAVLGSTEAGAAASEVLQPYSMKCCGYCANSEVIALLFLCFLSFLQFLSCWRVQAS